MLKEKKSEQKNCPSNLKKLTFPDKQKLIEVVNIRLSLQEMIKGSIVGNERTGDSNLKLHKEIKNTYKGTYIGKYKSQYYCTFGL